MNPLNSPLGRWRRLALSLAAYASLALLYLRPVRADDVTNIHEAIRKRFPTVRQLSTADLAAWLADTNRPVPLLVDVRPAEEFAVSHLPKAQNFETAEKVKTALGAEKKSIVVYCSVGYRSSALAEKLEKAGLTNVWNLEGSIFKWANEGRPVFRGSSSVSEVHPFDAKWGKLLDARYHPKAAAR